MLANGSRRSAAQPVVLTPGRGPWQGGPGRILSKAEPRRFIVRNHRDRKKLTLSAPHSETVTTSNTLTLSGKRVLELSDRVCEKYADSIDEYLRSGALLLAK